MVRYVTLDLLDFGLEWIGMLALKELLVLLWAFNPNVTKLKYALRINRVTKLADIHLINIKVDSTGRLSSFLCFTLEYGHFKGSQVNEAGDHPLNEEQNNPSVSINSKRNMFSLHRELVKELLLNVDYALNRFLVLKNVFRKLIANFVI